MKRLFTLLLAVALSTTIVAAPSTDVFVGDLYIVENVVFSPSKSEASTKDDDAIYCKYNDSDGNTIASCILCNCDKLAKNAKKLREQ
jgi:hypothetical protein